MSEFTVEEITDFVKPVLEKSKVTAAYLLGGYKDDKKMEDGVPSFRVDIDEHTSLVEFTGLIISLERALKTKVRVNATSNMEPSELKDCSKFEICIYTEN